MWNAAQVKQMESIFCEAEWTFVEFRIFLTHFSKFYTPTPESLTLGLCDRVALLKKALMEHNWDDVSEVLNNFHTNVVEENKLERYQHGVIGLAQLELSGQQVYGRDLG